ncbi:MAG: biopolymer transporter ExbD, partial [Chthoniobacterales bacterium]
AEEITLDDEPITLDALGPALKSARESSPDRPVAMQADREAPFGVIVSVLDALKDAGIKNLPAFTNPLPADSNPQSAIPNPQ